MNGLEQVVLLASAAILGYYLAVQVVYLLIHVAGVMELDRDLREARWGPIFNPFDSPFLPGIAVVVPAYNEEAVIEASVQSLLDLDYPDTEVVVVNDGSTDGTLARLIERFDLVEIDARPPVEVPTTYIDAVYRSADAENLLVVDKVNGGTGDALNAGLWLTEKPLFCTVDADTLISRDGLMKVVRPFLENPDLTVATGGTVRTVNGCTVEGGQVVETGLPGSWLAKLQAVEYLRAFYSGRLGLTKLDSLVLISGAFGLFRTDVVRDIGGFDTDSVTEDFELTVRLHRHLRERDRPYTVDFVPEPVVWTEVPEDRAQLGRQRRRWYRGLVDTLVRHRDMIGNPRYGRVGTFALPLFVLVEALGPLLEGVGYLLVTVAFLAGLFALDPLLLYFMLTVGVGLVLSWLSVFGEVWSFRRYDRPRQVLALLAWSVVENFGYRQWRTVQAWRGLIDYLRGVESWGKMERRGFGNDADDGGE
ncbi:MAG: glycosyltransferase [Halorientalis sp.]